MDDSLLTVLAIAAGVALLYFGSRIRSRSRARSRRPDTDAGREDA